MCFYSAPGLRWFLVSNLETRAKGVCHAHAVLGDSETQDPWWCGGKHPPDMGRPMYGSVCWVTPTAGILLGLEIQSIVGLGP